VLARLDGRFMVSGQAKPCRSALAKGARKQGCSWRAACHDQEVGSLPRQQPAMPLIMRIRSRLLLLVLAMLIPAFLTAGLGIAYVYHTAQADHRNTMREIARAMALVLDKELGRRVAVLDTLGQSKALDDGDLGTFYAQARRVAPTPDTAILLHNVDGHILFN